MHWCNCFGNVGTTRIFEKKKKRGFFPYDVHFKLANPGWGVVVWQRERLPSVVRSCTDEAVVQTPHPGLAPFLGVTTSPYLAGILTQSEPAPGIPDWEDEGGSYVFWSVTHWLEMAFSFAAHGLLFQCLLLALVIAVVGQCSLSPPDGEFRTCTHLSVPI